LVFKKGGRGVESTRREESTNGNKKSEKCNQRPGKKITKRKGGNRLGGRGETQGKFGKGTKKGVLISLKRTKAKGGGGGPADREDAGLGPRPHSSLGVAVRVPVKKQFEKKKKNAYSIDGEMKRGNP